MDRRELLTTTSLSIIGQGLFQSVLSAPLQAASAESQLLFDKPMTAPELQNLEGRGVLSSSSSVPSAVVLIHWDEKKQAFVKSREVQATHDSKTYTLDAVLMGSRIQPTRISGLQGDNLQINFNVGVPSGSSQSDMISWLILSGVDVFGGTKNAIKDNLVSFDKAASITGALSPGQTISIVNGKLVLGLELSGHQKNSWWEVALRIGTRVASAPFFGQLGLPLLAQQTLQFATSALNKITQSDKLVPILQSRPLQYTIDANAKGVNDRYKLTDGLWVAMDLTQAEATNYLAGYVLDVDNPLFPVRQGKSSTVIDADYMVVQLSFTGKAA